MSKQQAVLFQEKGREDNEMLKLAGWALWRSRSELALLLVSGGLYFLLHQRLDPPWAAAAVALAWVIVLTIPPVRRALVRTLHTGDVRRRWHRACLESGIVEPPSRRSRKRDDLGGPRVRRVERVSVGERLHVKCTGTSSPELIRSKTEEVAVKMKARTVRVTDDSSGKHRCIVTLVRRDPFDGAAPLLWPLIAEDRVQFHDPIPVAVDEDGEPVMVKLFERNVLIGGEPGGGKSVQLNLIVAAAALDPTVRIWLLDGKLGTEMAPWRECAETFVGPEPEPGSGDDPVHKQAVAALDQITEAMNRRYADLTRLGLKKWSRDTGLPLHLIVVDELAYFTSAMPKASKDKFVEQLRHVVSLGRAAGFITVTATQKPEGTVVPTAIRDLINLRVAFRCTTPQASDTILGQGQASRGADASTVRLDQRGVGFILGEGDAPRRMRGYFLHDDDVYAIAARAVEQRRLLHSL